METRHGLDNRPALTQEQLADSKRAWESFLEVVDSTERSEDAQASNWRAESADGAAPGGL